MKGSGVTVVAWESTGACNLACRHCRAEATGEPSPDELGTSEVKRLLDQISERPNVLFIISGGEPLLREDIFEIASYGVGKGLRVVLSSNGTLFTTTTVRRIVDAGIKRVSVSIDGPTADLHDEFRGLGGAFNAAVAGVRCARAEGLQFQMNTTVTRQNLHLLPDILSLARNLGAVAWDVFILVPVGRGLEAEGISPEAYKAALKWLYETSLTSSIPIKVTCGPTYTRISMQGSRSSISSPRGCMAGDGFCFVSRRGEVFPCGYLPISAGHVAATSFWEIYDRADIFRILRDRANLKGKCGMCEFREVCRGCRARAFSARGDYMEEDPLCPYASVYPLRVKGVPPPESIKACEVDGNG